MSKYIRICVCVFLNIWSCTKSSNIKSSRTGPIFTYSCLNWLLEQFPPSWSNPEMVVQCHLHVQWMAGNCLTYVTLHSSYKITPKPQLVSHVLLILVPNKWEFSHGPSLNLICKLHQPLSPARSSQCWSLKVAHQIWTTIHSNCCWETKVDQ